MAARASGLTSRIGLTVILAPPCVALIMMAGLGLQQLDRVYRRDDVALTERPETFQAWFSGASPPAQRVADRIGLMSLKNRRDLAEAVTRPGFWALVTPKGTTARQKKETMRDGVLLALADMPTAGDLYLAAAWLETTLNGFGPRPRAWYGASQMFAPREMPIILQRLRMAPLVWSRLDADGRKTVKLDMDRVRASLPQDAPSIEQALAAQGVVFN